MHRITCLEDEILDIVFMEYIQFPVIKINDMDIIEEHLGI